MSGQQEVTQILDLGTNTNQEAQSFQIASGGTRADPFNSALNLQTGGLPANATGFQPVASQVVTHEVAYSSGLKGKMTSKNMLIILGVSLVCVFGLVMFGPFSMDEMMVTLGFSEPPAPPPAPRKVAKAPQPTPKVEQKPAPEKPKTPKGGNVWLILKNEMGDDLPELAPPLTADQEATLKDKLSHQFIYQHYVGVLELSALRASGSEELLRGALESKKFWTRMRALIGLADLGQEITPDDVKLALGDAHSELRARFFQRFEKSPCTAGCFYVARAALPHLDELGRAQVVKVISREESDIRDKFMVAASYDGSEAVRAVADEWLSSHSVEQATRDDVRSAVGR